jgi:dipeptidase E
MTRSLLLISTSTVHGSGYLDYCADEIASFLRETRDILFVPHARPSGITHDEYTARARARLGKLGLELTGVHECDDPQLAIRKAEALFVGGGNTFLLLRQLYELDLVKAIRSRVRQGLLYVGTSAGSNVAGLSIGTTNDMPIAYPPSLEALALVPFNLNPHYLDPDPASTHKGETRETRINEFHVFNSQPVVGLREGAWIRVTDDQAVLEGTKGARLFRQGESPKEFEPGARLDFLIH